MSIYVHSTSVGHSDLYPFIVYLLFYLSTNTMKFSYLKLISSTEKYNNKLYVTTECGVTTSLQNKLSI